MSFKCTSAGHRPKTIRLFINRSNAIDFDEAETVEPTQEIELSESSYDAEGVALVNLRYVKFQRVNTISVTPISNLLISRSLLRTTLVARKRRESRT